jgi:hypothetical protein
MKLLPFTDKVCGVYSMPIHDQIFPRKSRIEMISVATSKDNPTRWACSHDNNIC